MLSLGIDAIFQTRNFRHLLTSIFTNCLLTTGKTALSTRNNSQQQNTMGPTADIDDKMKYLLLVIENSEFKPDYHALANEAAINNANNAYVL